MIGAKSRPGGRISLWIVGCLLAMWAGPLVGAGAPPDDRTGRAHTTPAGMAPRSPAAPATVIVRLHGGADLGGVEELPRQQRLSTVVRRLQQANAQGERRLRAALGSRLAAEGARVVRLWGINALAVTASSEVIHELAEHPAVADIVPDRVIPAPQLALDAAHENATWNLARVGAPELWARGIRGQGVVVANLDSGVNVHHPDLAASWRGGENSWFDPYGEFPALPVDPNGHGTAVMGLMVGGDASGIAIGMAPEAQWIAARIFDRHDGATLVAIHQAFQWLLDPDGDPDTPDAPHIVCNSWSLAYAGCTLEFQEDLRALRAAGIVPVFAAGNAGPAPASSTSPANNPEALAVGVTDVDDNVYVDSSRGPSSCGEPPHIFPELAAPGVSVFTSGAQSNYVYATGTSMAAPHVAGGLALLLSAFPQLPPPTQEDALLASAVDIAAAGPDNNTGYGRLELPGAYRWLSTKVPRDVFFPYLSQGPALSWSHGYLPLIQ